MKDIEKRKPKHASAEFWGGTVKVWEGGKQVEQQSDGWIDEMCMKTLKREVFSSKHMPIDPLKVDEAFRNMKMRESQYAEAELEEKIETKQATIQLDIPDNTSELDR